MGVMGAAPVLKLTVEEFLELDRKAEVPSEYHDGEMFPVEASTLNHAIIALNLGSMLKQQLGKTPCRAAGSSVHVRVSPTQYLIPDLLVVCGKPALTDHHRDVLTNPKVVAEILSPSTADYDYGEKFRLYRLLESLKEYILVAQDSPRVEVFRQTPDSRWILTSYEGLDATVRIETLEIAIPMSEIYGGVDWSETDLGGPQ
jgi:Uma2 family endonuclease